MKMAVFAGIVMLAAFTVVPAQQNPSAMPHDMAGMMQMMENCMMNLRDVDMVVSDTTDGVAVTFRTKDTASLESLRKQVRDHMAHMQKGDCPMMSTHQ